MRTKLCSSLLLAALLAACAGEDGAAGADGTSCTVTSEGGAATIDCGDGGTTVLDPGACSVASDDEGTHTITCPGGGSVVIRDGEKLPRGTIAGTATPYGLDPVAGIEVTLVQEDQTVLTDELGQFAFEDLKPGIYSLRFSYPGYAPLDVENVVVLGTPADLGTVKIKLGRKIATGMVMPIPFADHRYVGLARMEWYSEITSLSILDLETNTETRIAEEVEPGYVFEDRFLVTRRYLGGDNNEVIVHDVQTATTATYGPSRSEWLVTGGLLLERDGVFTRIDLATGTETPIDAEFVDGISADFRVAVLGKEGAFATFDAATGTQSPWVTFEGWSWNYHSGAMAGFVPGEEGYALVYVSPTTGQVVELEADATRGLLIWASETNLLLTGSGEGLVLYDGEEGTGVTIDIQASWNVGISPDGRFITYTDEDGDWILRVGDNTPVAVVSPWPVWSGQWAVFSRSGNIQILDLESLDFVFEGSYWGEWWFAGELVALAGTAEETTLIDMRTGRTFSVQGDWDYLAATREVAFRDPETDRIFLHSLDEETDRDTGVRADIFEASPAGDALLIVNGSSYSRTLDLLSVEDLSVLPIDEQVFEADWAGDALWYYTGRLDFLPVAYDSSTDPFADLTLYRVVLP